MASAKYTLGDMYAVTGYNGDKTYYVLLFQTAPRSRYWQVVQLPNPTYNGRVIGWFKPSGRRTEKVVGA